MFVPGASSPGDKTPLETFVDDSVSRSLVKYFEDKGDSGKLDFVTYMYSLRYKCQLYSTF